MRTWTWRSSRMFDLQGAMDSLWARGVQQDDETFWRYGNCRIDAVGLKGFMGKEMGLDLGCFPILAAAVHAVFLILVVAQHVRSQLRPRGEPVVKEIGQMHWGAKMLCAGMSMSGIVRDWPQLSKLGILLYASDLLAWLTIYCALQQEEAKGRAFFRNILKAWWVVFLGLSTVALSATVISGSILNAVLDFAPFISSLFLTVICFTGYVYTNRVGKFEGLNSASTTPLLNESSPIDTSCQTIPIGSGFSRARFLSVLTFSWLNPLLSSGNKRPLIIEDIPSLDSADFAQENFEIFQEAWSQRRLETAPGAVPSMMWTLFKAFWRPFMISFLLILVWTSALFVAPVLQNLLISFMEEEHRTFAWGFTLVLVLLTGKLLESFSSHQLIFRSRKLGVRMWAGVGCAVYNKALLLSLKARQVRSVGEIINIMSADVQRLLEFAYYIQQGLAIPLQVVFAVIILFKVVGLAMLAGLSSLVIVLVINSFIVRRMRIFRARLLVSKDKRMRATTECLGNMKVIKLQAWDEMFRQRIEELREDERSWVQKFMYTWANAIHMVWTGPLTLSATTFLTMVLLGERLTPARVYTALTTFRIIQEPIRFVPDIIANIAQATVSLHRIGAFLTEDEVNKDAVEKTSDNSLYAVEIEEAAFSWDRLASEPALKDLNLKIRKGTCVAICGAVGSGKSSLLYSIMGELPRLSGSAKLSGRLAYVAQSAWIQNNTIRENILFGQAMDPYRYKEAVRVSGLEADLSQFPFGDDTEIGERGTTLSGGQKQRVQLARAVYQDADVYLLDDPFSAVDAHTGTYLFQECVKGALKEKTVILVTHQVDFLPTVDHIIVMRAPGVIVQEGTYSQLVQEGKDFGAFVEALFESLQNVTRACHTRSDEEPATPELLDSKSALGDRLIRGNSGKGEVLAVQLLRTSSRTGSLSESSGSRVSEIAELSKLTKGKLIQEEVRETGRINSRVLWAYLSKVGKGALWMLVFVPQTTTTLSMVCGDFWLAWGLSGAHITSLRLVLIYMIFQVSCSISVLARAKLVAYAGVATAQAFFTGMLNSLIRAPMSFIDSTPLGRILSRSSTDQSSLDLELPTMVAGVSNNFIQTIGTVLITTYVTPQILFLIVPLAWVFVRLQIYYITSARELSRLTALTEAPMFLHISESINGATTIRAFQEQTRFSDTNALRLETYERAYFHNFTSTEWLGLRLDTLSTSVLSCAAVILITLPKNQIAPGLAGMSLSYGLAFSAVLMRMVNAASSVENKMISAERVRQYSQVPSEAPGIIPDRRPAPGWPDAGRIEIQQLQIRYRPGSPLVLKGVSCVIHPHEKVGVVGRTGSGKSTLIQALFRLIEPAGGRILIDGLDITTIGLLDLRSALGVIPQEPTLFEGSIRSNLDPFNLCTDHQIWQALDRCELGQMVRDKPLKLHSSVSEQGENWSVGERQLLCLARAVLKRARILVLDEATASVDITTDGVIQCTIKQFFADCTVISVAHRIPTVIDSDRVLVLDNGHLMENNSPENLLANENSMFSKLVQEYTQRTESSSSLDSLDNNLQKT